MEAAGAGSASGSSSRAATPSYPYPPFDIGMSPSSGSAPSSSLTTTVAAAPALSEDTHRHYHPIDPTPAAAMASLSFATPPSSSPMAGPPQYDPHHSHAHAHAHHAAVDDLAPARSSPSLPGLSTLATPADSTAWQGNGWSVVPPSRGRLTGGWLSGEGVDAGRGCETTAWKGKGKEREAAEEADPELACHQVPSRAASRSASRSTSRVHSRATSPARRNGLRDLWEEREAESEGRIETIDGGDTHHHQDGQDAIMERSGILSSETAVTPLAPPATRKLCVRHQRMADEGTTARLQKSIESLPLSDQTAVNTVWSLFSSSPHPRRAVILQGLLTMCCFSQLSLLSSELALAIRIDPFSLFPREISLKVLGHLDAMSLGRAAQVSRQWRALADDDLLWRNMCEQHIERKCEKCGWGLPLLSERRRRLKSPAAQAGTPESRSLTLDSKMIAHKASSSSLASATSAPSTTGSLKRSITAAANAAARERQSSRTGNTSSAPSPAPSSPTAPSQAQSMDVDGESPKADGVPGQERPSKRQCSAAARSRTRSADSSRGDKTMTPAPSTPLTRPWKSVYCERLVIERNWRRGRHTIRTLQGHTDGIMCLQFSESLAYPSFSVVITGSYDRTARIWNLETGEELRVLRGHTRGVRCLQFDEAKLITGSMDRTLKIWNWRTGALVRTLEGHTEGIVCLHFDEDTLASGSADSNIKIWNFRTGECYTLRGHDDWVNAVTLWSGPGNKDAKKPSRSPSGVDVTTANWSSGDMTADSGRGRGNGTTEASSFLFSASDDGTIRLWDLALRECLLVYDGHVGQVQSIRLVMLDQDGAEKLSRGAGGGSGAEEAAGNRLARRGDHDQDEEGDEGSYFTSPNPGTDSAAALAASASCGYNPPAVPGGRPSNTGPPAIPEHFYHAAASGQHRHLARHARQLRRRKAVDPVLAHVQERLCAAGLVPPLPVDAEMADIDAGLDGAVEDGQTTIGEENLAASIGDDVVSAIGDGNANATATPSASTSTSKAASTNNHHAAPRPVLISGSLDNTLKVWDVRTGRCLRTLFGHVEGVWAIDVDKLRVVSASHDRTIKVWDRDTAHCQNTLVGHRGAVTCVALGDDKIVSGSDDGEVRVWSFAPVTTT